MMRAAKACCLGGVLSGVLSAGILFAGEPAGKPDMPSAAALQQLFADLQKAIQTRDYHVLVEPQEGEQLLRWREGDEPFREIAVGEVLTRLQTAASGSRPLLQERAIGRSGLVSIGTEGWPGAYPVRSFQFKIVGRESPRWRWVGCSLAERSDNGGGGLLADQETRLLPDLLKDLRTALSLNNFAVLKKYIPEGKMYFSGPCGSVGEPRDLDFGELTAMLLQWSRQVEILFNTYPDIRAGSGNSRTHVSIDTEGWTGEYPFLTFTFGRKRDDAVWRWEGIFYDVLPPLRQESGGERSYFSRPMLPRPGPRRFSTDAALRARISEIIAFGDLDALKDYAVKGTLIFGECSQQTAQGADAAAGQVLPAQQVIDSLKKNFPRSREISATTISDATFYETGGWRGPFPYVQFQFAEEADGWQFTGVTYCKRKQYDLPDDDSWIGKALKMIFR